MLAGAHGRGVVVRLLVGLTLALAVATLQVQAQDAPGQAPVLTDLQRLQVTTVLQAIELAQLRAQLAQKDFDAARQQLAELARRLERPGWELDLQAMTYRPAKQSREASEP